MRRGVGSGSEILRFLAATALLSDLDAASLEKLAERMKVLFVPAGTVVIRQGEIGDALYVVVNGRLRVSVLRELGEIPIAEVGRGELIGEMALLTDEPRSATVTAIRDSQMLRLTKSDFLVLVKQRPTVLMGISRLIIRRLQVSLQKTPMPSLPRTIAVAPIGDGVDVARFSAHLVRTMHEHGSVISVDQGALGSRHRYGDAMTSVGERIVIDPRRFRELAEHDPASSEPEHSVVDGELTQWLHRMESTHDFIIYLCDPDPSAWTMRCLRQADRILLVASSTANAALGPIERALDESDQANNNPRGYLNRELVLLYDSVRVDRPRGTDKWLKPRQALRYHHARLGNDKDLQRLCRKLIGREIGVVLGGGGARACAEIGVLRALEEMRIPIDAIGGTSAGAIMGAGPAMGWDWKTLREGVKRMLVDPGPPIDYTVPIAALTKGRKATERIRKTFGDYFIEDLWIPYFAISSNLTRGAVNVHRAGELWQAIRASVALPGVLPPMRSTEGDVLVDGGIMNNLPVDVMNDLYRVKRILAVNVTPEVYMGAGELPDDGIVSGWRLLGRTVNTFGERPKLPGIGQILLRTTETGNVLSTLMHEKGAELTFNPPVAGVGLMEFSAFDKLAEVGYRHAMERLEGWLKHGM